MEGKYLEGPQKGGKMDWGPVGVPPLQWVRRGGEENLGGS